PVGSRQCGCKPAGKDARAGCAPDLVGLDSDRTRRHGNRVDGLRHVDAEWCKLGADLLAVIAGALLHGAKVTRRPSRFAISARGCGCAMKVVARLPSCAATVARAVWAPPSAALA